ncbi:site-2 protease family protein [Porcipelethomonas sp.]|uniref:site-2 protease family protein n=1 Tax=Porcipelethomonas sp. TaxID=2981675 RepID=UPI003EF900C8
MININIGRLKLSFDFSFFAVVALFCLLDAPELALTAVCACVIHELGHCIAAVLTDVQIERVIFWAGGVKMVSDIGMKPISSELMVLAAGPVFNFLAALLYFITGENSAFSVNFILGLFNLLPFSSLDGGSIIEKILEYNGFFSYKYMRIISLISAVIIISFFCITGTGNITGYITLILLAIYEFK